MNDNKIGFKTPRDTEAIIFEGFAMLLIIVLWVLTGLSLTGHMTYYGPMIDSDTVRDNIAHNDLMLAVIGTVVAVTGLVCAYFPKTFNINIKEPKAEHYIITVRFIRIVVIVVLLVMISNIIWPFLRIMQYGFIAGILLSTIWYGIAMYRVGK